MSERIALDGHPWSQSFALPKHTGELVLDYDLFTFKERVKVVLFYTRNQALQAWILEFEMSVHQICKFDPF